MDLEDAVPLAEKDAAREAVATWLAEQPADGPLELWVRVNPGDRGLDDVRRLAGSPALAGLALAKADAATVAAVAQLLDDLGDRTTRLMPLVETPAAVLDVRAIAAGPRVHRLQVGEVDLTGEAGIDPGPDERELLAIRTMVVLASAAAGIEPPVGPVSRITSDVEALTASTRAVARLGFVGRACIHPAQLPVVHDVFTPTPEQVEEARATLQLLAEAERRGSGVALDAQGRLVDPAVVHAARRVLALHELAERSNGAVP
ncbi:aldolase/citrate lyase family protein [Nocardioides sp. TF02-7]|uniref:HpcH/HpaI aldolase/citrate lyase family protein n=1 Tax=Nocardioides sp. TF02-7 TaxID=2917724 RepID=UPI001F060E77|nr:aldolase/citrate lyase family protein [Nocardioides sp. TF02-7]UMG93689.1 aldolase/citrate lyase family protein [Nocardioides sp. TF02-7]